MNVQSPLALLPNPYFAFRAFSCASIQLGRAYRNQALTPAIPLSVPTPASRALGFRPEVPRRYWTPRIVLRINSPAPSVRYVRRR
ncbi:hypothetical protein Tdes44962_MAKER09557 [Teratosphaeria destructans]|uniref:Uncharacterized protein n=1 Tax=Teratosphaeria destructans TaxID=418781 RepID=A0A9W7W310_9PEZI|nr:hypothetical protein Tdes44962_MAKER09557 [Teratosphaeria destructans]